jgi:hypothetical protein
MLAKSVAQQQFFGVVHAMQKGDMPKKGNAGKVAKTISKKSAKDFASTSTKGLPKKVAKESYGKYSQRDSRTNREIELLKTAIKTKIYPIGPNEGKPIPKKNLESMELRLIGLAGPGALKEASSRSKFKSGQTVIATSNHQGLKNGEEYKVSDVDVTWLLGQGYTTVTVRDKFGKEFVVNNPQVSLIVKHAPSSYYKTHDGIGRPIKEEITDWTTVKNEYWYKDKNRALAVKKYLESKGVKPKLYAAGNRYKLKWEWTKIQQDSIPASELEEEDNENRGLLKILRADLDEVENDQIKGGKADDKSYSDFDQDQLAKGAKVEMEHTDDPALAKEIAADHLAEFPNYYDALADMENKLKKQNEGMIKLKPLIKESSFAALVKLPDSNSSFIQDRINKVAAELNGKVDPYHEGGDAYKLVFKSKAGLETFIDKARALFGRSGAEIEVQESKIDDRPTQMLTANKKKLTEEYNTSMILPSSTRLNSEAPEKNVYTADWMTDKDDGTIYLVNFNGKKIFVYSSGKPDPNDKFREGTTHEFKHDQTYKRIGIGKIEKIVLLSKLKGSHLGNYPLYVFK